MEYKPARCFVKSWSMSGDAGTAVNIQRFVMDPVGTLRQHKIAVSAAQEHAWQQLARSLQALQHAPAQSGSQPAGAHAMYLDIQIPVG
jgi:hypothetical protein